MYNINKEENKKYTFVPKSNWIENVKKQEKIFENDVYSKYNCVIENVTGELIECTDLTKLDDFSKKIVKETYQEYKNFISQRDFKKEQWVYNILDGVAEQDKILYRDDLFVLLPNYTWNYVYDNMGILNSKIDLSQMYLLAFPTDKLIHSLRDLNDSHIKLLEHIQLKTLQIIKKIFDFDSEIIRAFVHYSPSTYHFHIHWTLITNINVNSSVEYSHNLSNIITNIKIKNDYYQIVELDKRVHIIDDNNNNDNDNYNDNENDNDDENENNDENENDNNDENENNCNIEFIGESILDSLIFVSKTYNNFVKKIGDFLFYYVKKD
jgi:hypothetical protein